MASTDVVCPLGKDQSVYTSAPCITFPSYNIFPFFPFMGDFKRSNQNMSSTNQQNLRPKDIINTNPKQLHPLSSYSPHTPSPHAPEAPVTGSSCHRKFMSSKPGSGVKHNGLQAPIVSVTRLSLRFSVLDGMMGTYTTTCWL